MNRFIKYLDDENFIRWICNNDPDGIQDKNDNKQQFASMLKKILNELNIKEAHLSQDERTEILNRLLQEIESSPKSSMRVVTGKWSIANLTRYAAAALIVLAMGTSLYLLLPQKEDSYTKYFSQETQIQSNNNTQIILADGRVIDIDSKNANIQYDKDKIIIDRNDTLSKEKDLSSISSAIALNQIIIPYGRTARLTLPDGSTVHLNAGTHFKYPPSFSKHTREVMLKGEAYFEIASDKQRPFIVNANDRALIKVLGTHFDVSAYEDDNSVKTTLVEGSISISSTVNDKWSLVAPGEQVEMNAQGKMTVKQVDTEQYTSWREGIFMFDKESFSSVLKKVERYYNIRFAFEEPLRGEIKISGKLNLNTEMEEIIEVLQTTSSTSISSIKGGYYVVK
ncbi:MAG: hypothetical protein A2X18_11650 [Bacteroidetes bacterium GWF2_40_14]|nr:MAG: hypothetical protein A2X18_11650 [Bacteroidetes bacterium GWF2_40_14]